MFVAPARTPSLVSGPASVISHPKSHIRVQNEQTDALPAPITKRIWMMTGALLVSNFLQGLVFACMAPFFPKEAEQKGASAAEIGLIFGIYQFINVLSSPVTGKLIKFTGAKFMLIAGVLTNGVTTLLFGYLGHSPPGSTFLGLAIAIRVFQAVGDSGFMNAAFTIIAKEVPDRISVFIAITATSTDLGFTIGPAFGGSLYDAGGFSLPFVVLGTSVLMAMIASMIFIPKDMAPDPDTETHGQADVGYLTLLKSPVALILLMTTCLCGMGPSMLDPTLEPHLRMFHLAHSQIGLMFLLVGGMALISSIIFGFLTDKFAIGWQVMASGCFLAFFALLLLGPCPVLHIPITLWLTGISMSLLGFAMSMQFIPVYSLLTEVATSKGFPDTYETNGLISGLFQSCLSFGLFLGPVFGSIGRSNIGFGWTTSVFAVVNLIGCIVLGIYIFFFRKLNKGTNAESMPLKSPVNT